MFRSSCLKGHSFRSLNHCWCFQKSKKTRHSVFLSTVKHVFGRKQFVFTPASSQSSIEALYFWKSFLWKNFLLLSFRRKLDFPKKNVCNVVLYLDPQNCICAKLAAWNPQSKSQPTLYKMSRGLNWNFVLSDFFIETLMARNMRGLDFFSG